MTNKVFKSILMVASIVLLASFIIIFGVLFDYYDKVQDHQLETQTKIIAHAVTNEGAAYFEDFNIDEYRVTWINNDGTVLFDTNTDAKEMENHSDREEFKEAIETGRGESSRYSSTLTEEMHYNALKLDDGSVIRVATSQKTVFTIALGMLQPIVWIFILAMIISIILSFSISKKIVEPLNGLDLDNPLDNDTYEEITPLLKRIEYQHNRIDNQINELRQRREEWNTVTECMKEGIVLLNKQKEIVSINNSAAILFDTDIYCIGSDFLTINRKIEIQNIIDKALSSSHGEVIVELKKSEYQINSSPVIDDDEVKGVVLLVFDVSEKIKAEKMRREFTANVSHELKTPLHSISGCAEIMKNGLVQPDDTPKFIEQIYNESSRMISLVEDIIRLSKLDEGVSEIPKEAVNLLEMADDVKNLLTNAAHNMNVSFEIEGNNVDILGNRPLIHELMFNLCDNAIKYNREGGKVKISVKEDKNEVELTVSDTGIGIPKEHQERIFERFYRVDKSHSRQIGGTGLGLSIVKHVAMVHGAEVEVESNVGEGTCFRVKFGKA